MMKNKTVVLKAFVVKFESLKDDVAEMNLNYGVLEDQSEIICKVGAKSKTSLKINTDRIEEKSIFIKNPNF